MHRIDLAYPAFFQRDPETPEVWEAYIPGLDGSGPEEFGPGTAGDDLEDCRRMASGLVDSWLVTHMREGDPIPPAGPLPAGDGWELVRPSLRVQWVVTLRELRRAAGYTQAQAATLMEVKQPNYARLEDPAKANPTLSTIERIQKVFGADVRILVG